MCVVSTAIAGTTLGSALGTASTVAGIVGTGLSVYSSYQQSQAQAANAEYQAEVAEQNAKAARQQAEVEEGQKRREVAQQLGSQRATFAANGVDISDPDTSANYILGDTAQWGDYDAKLINYNGQVAANNYTNQANAYSSAASSYSGSSLLNAGSSLLSGASSVANSWYNYSKSSSGTGSTILNDSSK